MLSAGARGNQANKKLLNRRHEKLDGQMRPMGAEFPVLIALESSIVTLGAKVEIWRLRIKEYHFDKVCGYHL